jgi:hypothetical protein
MQNRDRAGLRLRQYSRCGGRFLCYGTKRRKCEAWFG